MRIAHYVTLAASLFVFNQYALSAEGDQKGGGTQYPRTLTAAEVKRLYGERPVAIEYAIAQGTIRWDVFPDGRLFGHNVSAIGGAAALYGNSAGKWKVDESTGKVCHEWENTRWTNSCSMVVETGPGSYTWSRSGGPGGLKFTIKPQ